MSPCQPQEKPRQHFLQFLMAPCVPFSQELCRMTRPTVMKAQQHRQMELWMEGAESIEWEGIDAVIDAKTEVHDVRKYYRKENMLVSDQDETIGVIAKEQADALAAIGSAEWIVVTTSGRACMILLENVLSAAHLAGGKVAAMVRVVDDIRGTAFALDIGVDAIILPKDCDEILWEAAAIAKAQRAERVLEAKSHTRFETVRTARLDYGIIQSIEPAPVLADRVAIDLVRLLYPGEGALVGSSSKALALVHAETLPSSLVAPRPFRVNAGPVHSYILLADGTTKYLSELVPGKDCIAIVNTQAQDRMAKSRPVAVGRLKIETRPHLRIDFKPWSDKSQDVTSLYQIFLQHAETVRLVVLAHPAPKEEDEDNRIPSISRAVEPRSVTSLKQGDIIIASFSGDSFGTHCGASIAARVVER